MEHRPSRGLAEKGRWFQTAHHGIPRRDQALLSGRLPVIEQGMLQPADIPSVFATSSLPSWVGWKPPQSGQVPLPLLTIPTPSSRGQTLLDWKVRVTHGACVALI